MNQYLAQQQNLKVILAASDTAVDVHQHIKHNINVKNTLTVLSSHQTVKNYEKILMHKQVLIVNNATLTYLVNFSTY